MAVLGRSLAVGASVALHAAVGVALFAFAREPVRRALERPEGAVEVGVVFSEPRARPGGAASTGSARGETLAAAPPRPEPAPRPRVGDRPARDPQRPPAEEPTPVPAPTPDGPVVAAIEPPGSLPVAAEPEAEGQGSESVQGSEAGEGVGASVAGTGSGPGEAGAGAGAGTGSGPGAQAGGAGPGGAEDVDLALRRRLAESAARCYPRAAQRFRAEGTTKVRFCVAEDGRPRDEEIVESSGQRLLDEAALRCVIARAAPFPRTAECFTVPIHFFVR